MRIPPGADAACAGGTPSPWRTGHSRLERHAYRAASHSAAQARPLLMPSFAKAGLQRYSLRKRAFALAWGLMRMLDRLMYSPFLAQVVVTRRCNLACRYCNEFDGQSPPVALEALRKRLDHLRSLGTLAVELTGGEPLLHPDILELIRYARSIGFAKVMMISNAFLLNAAKVRALGDAGLSEMQVSVDGVEPNDTTVKVLRTLAPKLRMLAGTAQFKVVVSAVLGAAPPQEVVQVVAAAKGLGFRPRVLVLHDAHGQVRLSAEERSVFALLKKTLGRRFEEARGYRRQLLDTGSAPFRCRAGSRYLYIDEHGDAHWCSQTREVFHKALLEYGWEDLRKQFHTPKGCAPSCTVGCVRTQSAYDEWRGQAAVATAKPVLAGPSEEAACESFASRRAVGTDAASLVPAGEEERMISSLSAESARRPHQPP